MTAADEWQEVEIDEIPSQGEMIAGELGSTSVLVVNMRGTLYALGNLCSHENGWLDMGTLWEAEGQVECPMHGGRFEVATGRPAVEPCTVPVQAYAVRRNGDRLLVRPMTGMTAGEKEVSGGGVGE